MNVASFIRRPIVWACTLCVLLLIWAAMPFCGVQIDFGPETIAPHPFIMEWHVITCEVGNNGVVPVWYRECDPGFALGAVKRKSSQSIDIIQSKFAPWKRLDPGDAVLLRVYNVDINDEWVGVQLCDWMNRRKTAFNEVVLSNRLCAETN